MNKREVRQQFLAQRQSLAPAVYAQLNLELYHRFFSSVDLSFVRTLHTYLPIERNKEPDTWPIIDRIRREFVNVRIVISRANANGELENFYFEGLHQLETSAWGISEPRQGIPAPIDKIDMVIVPLLAVDQNGQRVGYGKGYYDRFLKKCRTDCKSIGLSFFEPIAKIDDADNMDVRLTACVTPSQFIEFTQLP
jgi:5-formyltetrahydrofolate cyclo-ligase